jgi:hypothetical protein
MKKWMLCVLFAVTSPVFAASAAPASEASVRELLEVTQARQMVEQAYTQVESTYVDMMRKTLGDEVTPENEARLQRVATRMAALLKKEMGWDTLVPMYIDIYSKSFSEEEIQGMLAFYRTPAGRAVIDKMPLVMQNTMLAVQGKMGDLIPEIQKMVADELKHVAPPAPAGN